MLMLVICLAALVVYGITLLIYAIIHDRLYVLIPLPMFALILLYVLIEIIIQMFKGLI